MKKYTFIFITFSLVLILWLNSCSAQFDKSNFHVIWEVSIDSKYITSPVYYNENIYLVTEKFIYSISKKGKIIYKFKYSNGEYYPNAKPIVFNNYLYFGTKNTIYAFNIIKKKIIWKNKIKENIDANIFEIYKDTLIVAPDGFYIYFFDLKTGKLKMKYNLSYDYNNDGIIDFGNKDDRLRRISVKPIIENNIMFLNSSYYTLAIKLMENDGKYLAKDVLLWFQWTDSPYSWPVIYNNKLIVAGESNLYILNKKTGKILYKFFPSDCAGPIIYDQNVIFSDGYDPQYLYSLNLNTYKLSWKSKKDLLGSPGGKFVIYKNYIFFFTMGSFYIAEANTGKILYTIPQSTIYPYDKIAEINDNIAYIPIEVSKKLIAIKIK